MTKKLYEVKTDIDCGEKDGLKESVKVDMSNVDVEKEDSIATGTNQIL